MTSTKELATAIAARLPGEWAVTMPHDQADHYFKLTRADGLELGLHGQGEKGYIRTGSDPARRPRTALPPPRSTLTRPTPKASTSRAGLMAEGVLALTASGAFRLIGSKPS
jgi:hypothetical protein